MSFIREHVVKVFTRSSSWRKVRNTHIKLFPVCAVCGTKKKLEVHHIVPVSVDKELELYPENLMTLCRKHHFLIGHLEYWRAYNVDVVLIARYFKNLLSSRKLCS